MPIRHAMKAAILRDGCVLLNECEGKEGRYYAFPGGGQEPGETMREAMVREVLEETGYHVTAGDFLALYEEICDDPEVRRAYPALFHISYHFFRCELVSEERGRPSNMDTNQRGSAWIPLSEMPNLPVRPTALRDALPPLLAGGASACLGSLHIP